ncbi:hypothetical protein ACFUTR_30365, partial [Streptomyces sp. NPDC057367]|uniref:hypothetical protein n=1 Tax=Streptomyces sp. NPDC057367 TaxID=3346108 RepID=UPI0036414380
MSLVVVWRGCARKSTGSRPSSRWPFARCSSLEVLTKALDVAVSDEAGGKAEEGFVDVVASFP